MAKPQLTLSEFESMNFANQLGWAIENVGNCEEFPEDVRGVFSSAQKLVQMMSTMGGVSSEVLKGALQKLGVLVEDTEKVAPDLDIAKTVVEAETEEEEQPILPPKEPAHANLDWSAYLQTIRSTIGALYRDEKGRIRLADGSLVCKACLREMLEEPYVASIPRQLGPHMKAHEDKTGGWVDEVIIPDFESAKPSNDQKEEEEEKVVDMSPAEDSLSISPEPEHQEASQEFQTGIGLYGQVAGEDEERLHATPFQEYEVLSKRFAALEENIASRLTQLESTIAKLVLILLSLPEENKRRLLEVIGKEEVEKLAAIVTS